MRVPHIREFRSGVRLPNASQKKNSGDLTSWRCRVCEFSHQGVNRGSAPVGKEFEMRNEEQATGAIDSASGVGSTEDSDPDESHEKPLSRREANDEILIAALAAGRNYADAAELAGVDRRTVCRRMQLPEFARRVSEGRREHAVMVSGHLASSSPRAVETIVACLDDDDSRVRLAAAKLLVEMDLRARSINDIERELTEIRQLLAEEA